LGAAIDELNGSYLTLALPFRVVGTTPAPSPLTLNSGPSTIDLDVRLRAFAFSL